jgi:head-tail adaptor
MIAAGLLDKRITIQKLARSRDAFGSEVELWEDVFSANCGVVVPSVVDRRQSLNDAAFAGDRLTFRMRKYVCKYLALEYRIVYRCRNYRVLGIVDEGADLYVLAELVMV